jgi:hypothetical protein
MAVQAALYLAVAPTSSKLRKQAQSDLLQRQARGAGANAMAGQHEL